MKNKKLLMCLVFALILCVMAIPAFAESPAVEASGTGINVDLDIDTSEYVVTTPNGTANGTLNITDDCTVVLNGVNIASADGTASALNIMPGLTVTIILKGVNNIAQDFSDISEAGVDFPPVISVGQSSNVTIVSDGNKNTRLNVSAEDDSEEYNSGDSSDSIVGIGVKTNEYGISDDTVIVLNGVIGQIAGAGEGSAIRFDTDVLSHAVASFSRIHFVVLNSNLTFLAEEADLFKTVGNVRSTFIKSTIKAEAVTESSSAFYIGSGSNGGYGSISFYGSKVEAKGFDGGDGAGGAGVYLGRGCDIYLHGSEIIAQGGQGEAGISCNDGAVLIANSKVTATGGYGSAGIGLSYASSDANASVNIIETTSAYFPTDFETMVNVDLLSPEVIADIADIDFDYDYVKTNVTALGGEGGAGIGGGLDNSNVSVVVMIISGTVNATGGKGAAGIGGGKGMDLDASMLLGSDVSEYLGGGRIMGNIVSDDEGEGGFESFSENSFAGALQNFAVASQSGATTFEASTLSEPSWSSIFTKLNLTAVGNGSAAGIGGGEYADFNGLVMIAGGNITAKGGKGYDGKQGGAAIGGSGAGEYDQAYSGGRIAVVNTGTLTLVSNAGGAAIGCGYGSYDASVAIFDPSGNFTVNGGGHRFGTGRFIQNEIGPTSIGPNDTDDGYLDLVPTITKQPDTSKIKLGKDSTMSVNAVTNAGTVMYDWGYSEDGGKTWYHIDDDTNGTANINLSAEIVKKGNMVRCLTMNDNGLLSTNWIKLGETKDSASIPKTGDFTYMWVIAAVLALAGAGIVIKKKFN